MAVRKLYFYVNELKPEAKAARDGLAALLAGFGVEEVQAREADVIVALGGDGTILRAVRDYPGIPVIGFNLGGLGYLSSVERRNFAAAVEQLAQGRYRISKRALLALRRAGSGKVESVALNDVVLVREMTGHAACLDLTVDGHAATRYLVDGLVVATPTGSTAYSLSAGGPVLMPDAAGFVVTPMNPHALGVRPMVVPDTVRLTVTSRPRENGRDAQIGVYADGCNVFMLAAGEAIEISKSGQNALLIELEGHDPYEVLARKLGWRGSCVAD